MQNTLRSEAPGLRVLTIERGFSVSETFDDAGDRVQANSSVRPQDQDDGSTIPGVGNINNFPLGILQVPDVTAEGYPRVSAFSKVATVNRALASNPVLFGFVVQSIRQASGSYEVEAKVISDEGATSPKTLRLRARAIIDARGVGTSDLSNVTVLPNRNKYEEQRRDFYRDPLQERFPLLTTSQEFYSMVSCLSDPFAPFVNKVVAVVGAGDSSKTILEFLLRCQVSWFALRTHI